MIYIQTYFRGLAWPKQQHVHAFITHCENVLSVNIQRRRDEDGVCLDGKWRAQYLLTRCVYVCVLSHIMVMPLDSFFS